MKKLRIVLGGVLVAFPLSLLVSGCGGGSDGLPTLTPTPVPSSVATATPTTAGTATPIPVVALAPIQFALSDGRVVTARLQTQGRHAFGVISTPNATTAPARATNALPSIPLSWAGGNYAVDGTYTPPRSISLTGQVKQNGVNVPFVLRGTIPTQTSGGILTLVVAGVSVTVAVPATGGATATATPSATATTPPVGTGGSFSGTIVGSSDANFGTQAYAPANFGATKQTQGGITVFAIATSENFNVNNYRRGLTVTLSSASGGFSKGQVLPATALTSPTLPNAHVNPAITVTQPGQSVGSWGNFTVKSGQVTITDLTATSVTLTLSNVQVVGDLGSAKGTLTINGTLKSNYTTS